MEDTHRVSQGSFAPTAFCLNPCSNGRYSQRRQYELAVELYGVLILVLMEDTHRDWQGRPIQRWQNGLNPCSNGRYSQSWQSC